MAWHPRLVVPMHKPRQNSFPSVNSLASCTHHHSSIKVYLSGIRAVHIDQGFPDPLADCLHQQRVVRGIKRCQGTPSFTRLPVTDDLMLIIWQSLDLSLPDHMMFWAACSLGHFGFLRASEFTVPNLSSFSSSLHLSAQDITVDSSSVPSSMHIRIMRCMLWWLTLLLGEMLLAPCSYLQMGSLSLALGLQTGFGGSWLQLGFRVISHPIAIGLVLPLSLHAVEFQIT